MINSALKIDISSDDTLHNLKIDESLMYLINQRPAYRFWKGSPAMITGRFQNIEREINLDYCKSNKIPVYKRFSGGGTVYHDSGVLNVSLSIPHVFFMQNIQFGDVRTRVKFAVSLIRSAIEGEGFSIKSDPYGSLLWNGLKFCGSAAFMGKHRMLIHCSMLINADLNSLYESINWHPEKQPLNASAVESRRMQVVNLSSITDMNNEQIIQRIEKKLIQSFGAIWINRIDRLEMLNDFLTQSFDSIRFQSRGVEYV